VIGAEAGMHLVALLQPGVSDVAVANRAAQRGVVAMPLSPCYARPPARGGLILGYGGTRTSAIEAAMHELRMSIEGEAITRCAPRAKRYPDLRVPVLRKHAGRGSDQ
jgi:DNA-binding transcriptional MocR family regulator